MVMKRMINIILRLALINLIFAGILYIQGYWYWLLNFELAFISSVFIILGSFHGYKSMINKRLDVGEGMNDEMMDKLEDPYDLYDEDKSKSLETDQVNQEDLSAVVKEEKKRLKQDKKTLKKTLKSSPGIFSPLRVIPYAVLIMSFIGLNNNHVLDVVAFLVGLGVGIAMAIFLGKKWISSTNS